MLDSYLKGQRNDPNDIKLRTNVKIDSFYVMITEPKTMSSSVSSPFAVLDDKRYQPNSAVKEWFVGRPSKRLSELKDVTKSQFLTENSALLHNNSHSQIDIQFNSPDRLTQRQTPVTFF